MYLSDLVVLSLELKMLSLRMYSLPFSGFALQRKVIV